MASYDDTGAPADLGQAGAIVERAIDYMMEKQLDSMAIASALLGGALGVLVRSLDDAQVEHILRQAIDSLRSGELRRDEA